jgi:hypothetical protein
MAQITVTEGLAELTTIEKRIEKKRQFVLSYLTRPENLKDPLAREGNSSQAEIKSARQAIQDLEQRRINIRLAIQDANHNTPVTVNGQTKTLAEWLVWRKEVAEGQQAFVGNLLRQIATQRVAATRNGGQAIAPNAEQGKPGDIVVNVDELELSKLAEEIGITLDSLDGQLSLKNATVTIEV